jgi:hypothetical protein
MFVVNNMELFAENSDMYATVTRNSSNLHFPASNLTVFQKGPQYLGIKVYNSLPSDINSFPEIKSNLRMHYFSYFIYIYFIEEFFNYRDNKL